MPAFNEAGRVARTLEELAGAAASAGADITVFVVDDGSVPAIEESALADVAAGLRVVIARHAVNLGQGAALETARRLALDPRWAPNGDAFEAFVTMDSDGQHRPSDVLALAAAVRDGADVALGDRFAGDSNVPSSRRALLTAARAFEWALTGLRLSDVHNGLRAFGPRAMGLLRIRQNRMAHASEITRSIAQTAGLRVVEVPVSIRYDKDSLAKGQRASGAVAIVVDLFHGFLFGSR